MDTWQAVSAVLIATLGGGGALKIFQAWVATRSTVRKDTIQEWQKIAARYEKDFDVLHKDHKECEKRISQMEASILNKSPVGIIICGVNDNGELLIIDWNQAATLLFHWSKPEVMANSVEMLIPERLVQKHKTGLKRVLDTGQMRYSGVELNMTAMTKEGDEIPVVMKLMGWRNGTGWYFAAEVYKR